MDYTLIVTLEDGSSKEFGCATATDVTNIIYRFVETTFHSLPQGKKITFDVVLAK